MNKIPYYILSLVMSVLPICIAQADELKTVVNPEHLANTTQYGYSQATIAAAHARTIYVAGQIGISKDGPNDFQSQVDRSFRNMKEVLEAAGGKVQNIVKITLLIKDHDEKKLQYLVKKRREIFGGNPPASTLIPVTVLALDLLEFEIDAIAVVAAHGGPRDDKETP
jgi:enamine deaminase RidA (YjgF/YER057c/UK114 family)